MEETSQNLNFLDMAQGNQIGQSSAPNDFLTNNNSDHSYPVISVPNASNDSVTGGVHGPIHGETSYGYLGDLIDPLIIIQQCFEDKLPLVRRRLTPIERKAIRSGSIFAFIESHSKKDFISSSVKNSRNFQQMRRWTDGMAWSKSRVHGHFLVYKEIVEKVHIAKKHIDEDISISSMIKQNGLLKKTLSMMVDDCTWHVINYYYEDDVSKGHLACPSVIFPNVKVDDKLLDLSKLRLRSYGPSRDSASFGAIRPRRKNDNPEIEYSTYKMNKVAADLGISGKFSDIVNTLGNRNLSLDFNNNNGYITLRKFHSDTVDYDMFTVPIPSMYSDLQQIAVETFHISDFTFIGPQGKLTPENFPLLMDGDQVDISFLSVADIGDDIVAR